VVSFFPFRIDDRSLANFDNTVARHETQFAGGINQLYVRPLVPVVVHVVGDLAEEDALIPQNAKRFAQKWWKRVCKCVVVLFG